MKLLSQKALRLACLVCAIPYAHGAFVAAHYVDGASADSAALVNLAAITPGLVVSNLSAVGFEGGTLITRNEFSTDIPSSTSPEQEWLYSVADLTNDPAVSTDDFFGFSVTNNTTKVFDPISFTYDGIGVVRNDGGVGGLDARWQLFVSTNGGTTFTAKGETKVASILPNTTGYSAPLHANIDLASLAPIPIGGTYVFRLARSDNSSVSQKASFTQNIILTGAFIPEPSRPIFLLLSVLLVTWRRAR